MTSLHTPNTRAMDDETKGLIKDAVELLRTPKIDPRFQFKASHAHELVAAYLGYKSKAAIVLGDRPPFLSHDEPESLDHPDAIEHIEKRIGKLSNLEVTCEYASDIAEIISTAITPDCDYCNDGLEVTKAVEDEGNGLKYTCLHCVETGEQLGHCRLCGGDGKIYELSDLDKDSLCPNCTGEFDYDEEEMEDMESKAEYYLNHD